MLIFDCINGNIEDVLINVFRYIFASAVDFYDLIVFGKNYVVAFLSKIYLIYAA